MEDIKNVIEPEDVEWVMEWSKNGGKRDGSMEDEVIFEEEDALAHLLINDVVFLNAYWWKFKKLGPTDTSTGKFTFEEKSDATWTEEESKIISVSVNCNDVFAWGCSDAEELPYHEIENLYRMWRKDPGWGSAVWCMIQRRQMPQRPVEDAIRKAGVWDLDTLNLDANRMDDEVKAWLAGHLRKSPAPGRDLR